MPTNFADITFDNKDHSYFLGKKSLVSASTLVSRLKPAFDREGISKRKAESSGISQQELLQQWEQAGEIGRDKGTRLHSYVEDVFDGRVDPVLRGVNARIPEMVAFDAAWQILQSRLKAKLVKKEWMIGDEELGVAGRVDAILSVTEAETERWCVFDWKTGKFESTTKFQYFPPPFEDIPANHWTIYSFQVNLYRLIVERNRPDIVMGDPYLLHLRPDKSYMLHRALDLRERLADWLQNGIPEEYIADQQLEKFANQVIQRMQTLDESLILGLTSQTLRATQTAAVNLVKSTKKLLDQRSSA